MIPPLEKKKRGGKPSLAQTHKPPQLDLSNLLPDPSSPTFTNQPTQHLSSTSTKMQTKFVLAAALSALSTSVSAFIIPRDLPDGHFSFPLDGEFNTSDATALSRRQDFPDQTIGCTGGHYAHNNVSKAHQLASQLPTPNFPLIPS